MTTLAPRPADTAEPSSLASARSLSSCSDQERHLFYEIIAQVLAESAFGRVLPQHPFEGTDGRTRYIDFAIVSPLSKIAVELDGYTYHAEGVISRERFSDGLDRQNQLVLDGWTVLRFSWDRVLGDPEACRSALRRSVVGDPLLHPGLGAATLAPHALQAEGLRRLAKTREAGRRAGLVVMATGLGKTYLAAFDAARVGGRVLFVVHNNAILEQARAAFGRISPERSLGLFNGHEKRQDADVVFANVATLRGANNLARFRPDEFDYVVIDEFHHSATVHYQRVIGHFRPKFLLGMTATPDRTDRRSILRLVEDNVVYQVTTADAIQRGFLSPFRYHALKDDIDYSNIRHNGIRYDVRDLDRALIIKSRDRAIIDRYRAIAGDTKAIGFCVSIAHAERAAEHFREAGIPSVAIHSGLDHERRARCIKGFRNDEFKVALVRDLFNEGMDVPDVGALLFMRPTESRTIFLQQLGRGLRLSPGKKGVDVLDFIGNYVNAGCVLEYISSFGSAITPQNLRQKPIFYFDNGCTVTFETAAIDAMTVATPVVPSEDVLVKDLFDVTRILRRTPTLAELQSRGRYSLRLHLARFGTWPRFLERIRTLDDEMEIDALAWPTRFEHLGAGELDGYLDTCSEDFTDLLRVAADALDDIVAAFRSLGQPSERPRRAADLPIEDLEQRVHEMDVRVRIGAEALGDIVFLLDFRTMTPAAPLKMPLPDAELMAVAQTAARRLEHASSHRDVYVFPRAFAGTCVLCQKLSRRLRRGVARRGDEDPVLVAKILTESRTAHAALGNARTFTMAILASIQG